MSDYVTLKDQAKALEQARRSDEPKPKPPSKVQKLRSEIYGPPLANFDAEWPTDCQIIQHYIWCMEKKKADDKCKYIKDKNALVKVVVNNLLQHWKTQPSPIIIDEKSAESHKVFKHVKDLVKDYVSLEDQARRCDDKTWIANIKKQLQTTFDVELKSEQCKKRPIEEVSNLSRIFETLFPFDH